MDRRAAEHTAQTVHRRLTPTVPSQGPDHTGERTERISGAVWRYHRTAQPVGRNLQVPTVILPAKLVLPVAIRQRSPRWCSPLVSTAPSHIATSPRRSDSRSSIASLSNSLSRFPKLRPRPTLVSITSLIERACARTSAVSLPTEPEHRSSALDPSLITSRIVSRYNLPDLLVTVTRSHLYTVAHRSRTPSGTQTLLPLASPCVGVHHRALTQRLPKPTVPIPQRPVMRPG